MKTCLKLSIKFDKEEYKVGEKMVLTETVTNTGKAGLFVDQGSLQVYYEVRDEAGNKIEEMPIVDRVLAPKGAEDFLKIKAGEESTQKNDLGIAIEDKEWSGFGIPGGSFKGVALRTARTAGASIYPLKQIPGTYRITKKWLVGKDAAKERAKKYNHENPILEGLESNTVTIKVR